MLPAQSIYQYKLDVILKSRRNLQLWQKIYPSKGYAVDCISLQWLETENIDSLINEFIVSNKLLVFS